MHAAGTQIRLPLGDQRYQLVLQVLQNDVRLLGGELRLGRLEQRNGVRQQRRPETVLLMSNIIEIDSRTDTRNYTHYSGVILESSRLTSSSAACGNSPHL